MAKILVTGGAGFIGSHLCAKLLQKGEEVFVIDDLSTGCLSNIASFKKNKKFHFVRDTILNQRKIARLIKKCDQVYHLAAAVGVKRIMEKPLDSFLNNINGAKIVFEEAAKYKKPVLITSSSEVYGKNENIPFKENDNRLYGSAYNIRWGYGLSKAADEFMALAYFRENGLPIVIVRLFNVIGPRQTSAYGMVAPRFIKQALSNKPITIYGDGEQTRCFANVEDVTDALIKLMKYQGARGEIFNLGSSKEITIKALAQKIKQLTNSKSKIVFIPYAKAYGPGFEDMARRRPDLSKIKRIIEYQPKITLEESLKKIIHDFQG
jgi:UDP-glucose 4-epimerase